MQGGARDLSFTNEQGRFNLRVGILIVQDGRLLVERAPDGAICCTIGGRVHQNESTLEAARREAYEETGLALQMERLVFVHEGFFTLASTGVRYHELGYYYLAAPHERAGSIPLAFTEDGIPRRLEWIPVNRLKEAALVPGFLCDRVSALPQDTQHITVREDDA